MSTALLTRNIYISDKYVMVAQKETPYYDIFVTGITIPKGWSVE
jgi:hypothetical protein